MANREYQAQKMTEGYKKYQDYKNNFLITANVIKSIKQRREFYKGEQYDKDLSDEIPQPVTNIIWKYVENVSAKLAETDYSVEFIADGENQNLNKLDKFYEYQKEAIKDVNLNSRVIKKALIDGVAGVVTCYDEDEYGCRGKFRGYIKRKIIPFEDWFFANPYCEDVQDQKYVGYVQRISVEEARDLCEKKSDKDYIVPDNVDADKVFDYKKENIAFDTCTLVTRYFREKDTGEVMFQLSTKYVDLYKKPHYLSPEKEAQRLADIEEDEEGNLITEHERNTIQTTPINESQEEYENRLKVFWRYPVSFYRPYPIENSVLGDSAITQLIGSQKQINFNNMMAMLNFQSHGMSKWVVNKDALAEGQTIDNNPSQIIEVELPPGNNVASVVHRIEPSNVSAEQLQQASMERQIAEDIYGFGGLTSNSNLNDTSGYAIQQVMKQQNLPLQTPQNLFWDYIKDNALVDILFFRHYVDEAKFYVKRDEGSVQMQESYKQMAESVYGAYGVQAPGSENTEDGLLPPVERREEQTIRHEDFMKDFQVTASVIQGVGNSRISESQHYTQVMQMVMTGNADPAMIKAWIDADPNFSQRVRENLHDALEASENSRVAQLQATIEQYKQVVQQQNQALKEYSQRFDQANTQLAAYKKATEQNAQENKAIMDAYTSQYKNQTLSEGEVKSNNAKGIEDSSFDSYSTGL